MLNSVANLISLYKLQQDNQQLQQREQQRQAAFDGADLCGLVFASAAMERCIDLALQLARSDVSVLITGPNGAGKDKLADILHANSPLKHKPLIKVNVGALPMELMEPSCLAPRPVHLPAPPRPVSAVSKRQMAVPCFWMR